MLITKHIKYSILIKFQVDLLWLHRWWRYKLINCVFQEFFGSYQLVHGTSRQDDQLNLLTKCN